MPFKFSSKVFSQSEKHPISKERFETATSLITSLLTEEAGASQLSALEKIIGLEKARRDKLSFIKI